MHINKRNRKFKTFKIRNKRKGKSNYLIVLTMRLAIRNKGKSMNDMARMLSKISNKSLVSISTQKRTTIIIFSDSRKGKKINMKIPITIEDLYNGTTVKALYETR